MSNVLPLILALISQHPDVVAGEYPALYDLLRRYYRQDPLARLTKAASASSTTAS